MNPLLDTFPPEPNTVIFLFLTPFPTHLEQNTSLCCILSKNKEMPLATGKYDLCELAETFLSGMVWSSGFQHEIHFKVDQSEFILNHGFIGSCWFVDTIMYSASKSHITCIYRNFVKIS